jgi:type VI secretion system protein ImpH
MAVNFLGIATPNSFGSLPIPYVDEIRAQERDKNFAMRDFLDLFNHRLISLFYRAWERGRVEVLYELGEHSPFESALKAIIGVEGRALEDRLPLDARDLLGRAGLLAMRPGPATAIEGIISSVFGIPAHVHQFLPAWFEIDPADRTRLGRANSVLGESFNLGSQVCLSQYRFRVELGPMDFATYRSLLPQAEAFSILCSLIRLSAGPEFDFEISLVLEKEELPELRLGRADETNEADARLGWSTWLRTEPAEHDASDAVFTPSLALEEARDSTETRA